MSKPSATYPATTTTAAAATATATTTNNNKMHHTEQYVEHSQVPCLGICSHQEAWEMENTEDIQMPCRNSRNSQQHRGRRRRLRQRAEGTATAGAGAGFVGIFWSINLAILICLAHSTNAVPAVDSSTSSSSSSASSAIVTVSVTPSSLSSSSAISSTTESLLEQQQPQGQCLLDGLWVPETTARCEKQTSCRAIQRTGHCCPDYKCDCEKDGKTYANGYKLVDPDTPCRVCYCKGGEIVCSSVTCFRRDDCMPKYVPGRCCPEYDNCPILDNNPPLASDTSNSASTTAKPAPLAPPAGFNWNITIKEITKPTEIRITDDNHKVKQAIPTRKVPNTEAPTTPTAATSAVTATTAGIDAAATIESSTATVAAAAVTTEGPPASTAAAAAAGVSTAATAIDTPATPIAVLPLSQDTNQKALPVNGSSGESLKLIASVGYIDQPKPLVTYNADGLQPLAENDPSKVNIKREYTTEGVPGEALSVGAGSTYIQNGFRDALVDNVVATPELEPETAGSDNIYHIISTTEGPNSSGSTTERLVTTDGPELMSSTFGSENNTAALEISTEGLASELMASSTAQTVHHMEEDDVPQVESNPAYPSLPEDDFSLRDVNFPLVELEDIVEPESKDEQRSIATPFERDTKRTKHVTESSLDAGSGSGSGDMDVLLQALASTTENTLGQDSSSSANPGKASLSQVPLMYSAEDSSAEVRIQNVSELAKISRNQSENETSAELESGSGSGDLREPTTPRARSVSTLDIDELGSGAGQAQSPADDPKADAESLKLDEGQESNAATKEAAGLEKSFVEQAGAETGGLRLERLLLQRIY